MDETKARPARPARASGGAGGASPAKGGDPAQLGHALESLRVVTTFLVVLYHAALTYVATPLRLTMWVAYDASGFTGFDAFIYWVNGLAMPVFFLAAGVSAPAACESRGPRVFLNHRAHRLLRPLLFGCLTVLPAFYLIWGYGLMATGRCDLGHILSWRFPPTVRHNLYGFGHLWFLEYLFLVCVLWCGAWTLHRKLKWGRRSELQDRDQEALPTRLLGSAWRPLLFAIPTTLIFLVDSDTMLRVDNVIVPNLFRLLHYAFFFAVGGWISKVREPKQRLMPYGGLYLALSLVLFAGMLPLLLQHAASPLQGGLRIVFCVCAALFSWLTVFGGLGVLLRLVQGRGPTMRFLSEASFWIYIIHVPIVVLMQVLLLPLAWPGPLKFLLVSAVSIVLSILSYETIVRRSLVGEIINGARKRTTKPGRFGPEFGWRLSLGVATLLLVGFVWSSRGFLGGNNLHEEIPGRLYRSARLNPSDLDALIRREGLRTVVAFTGDPQRHTWFAKYQKVCQSHKVELYTINLRDELVPSRHLMIQLVNILESCPRPVVVQGYRGIDHSSFAAAVAKLLDGAAPREALKQFGLRYGQFGGLEHSPLGQTLLSYQDWLNAHHWPHTAERFRGWVREEYLINSFPAWPEDANPRAKLLARKTQSAAVTR
ncbi:Peptidoglycan/LPS O-acetylase OafA/YrhL, contains acyltransferase and SGNH-hydrolase domains [Singulisphaera sp. GP187]|uniref:acyltransferase family protein n=1 Tax=Singulisphaera sp. GP187 TaxID=1882752 RepID=UPI0009281DCF|nr:acyltransferase family protein [Singulisphaera sp. GP187]SIO26419.1 Peptidoglycan/LPS O-acetylase OafA/YrhL, contains acyltransferase and SGNH-hydrolase domains [Singulisphaera sp. GP187]